MEEYFSLLKELMANAADSANIERVNKNSARMQAFLESKGLYVTIENCEGRNVIYASTVPGKEADYLLNAHLDVVPAPEPELYTAKVEGNILRGRGSDDCLGNAICVARVLVELKGKASLGAIFTCDEEIGGNTTYEMVRRGYRGTRMAMVLDGGAYQVVTAQKGILILKLIARGKAGHGSCPWAYDNALDKLVDGYLRLRNAWGKVTEQDQWHNTMAPCTASAGQADNQIPDYAEMTLNIRYIKDEEKDKILAMARLATGLEVELCRNCRPMYSSENDPKLIALKDAIQKAFPEKKVGFAHMNGATDARHMVDMGVPVAIIGVPGGGAHSRDEWVDLNGIRQYAELLMDFMKS